jgi:nicotinamide riboside kinase
MPPKNVYIVGASSTGKTTLVNALAVHFLSSYNGDEPSFLIDGSSSLVRAGDSTAHDPTATLSKTFRRPHIIHELARPVLAQLRITRQDLGTSSELTLKAQMAILCAQCAAEREATTPTTTSAAAEHSQTSHTSYDEGEWLISDRSALDGMVYTELFVSEAEATKLLASEEWLECRQRMREGIVFLCESGGPWLVDDGVRSMPKSLEDWVAFDDAFERMARMEGIEVRVIPKEMLDLEERVRFVVEAMHGWREAGGVPNPLGRATG